MKKPDFAAIKKKTKDVAPDVLFVTVAVLPTFILAGICLKQNSTLRRIRNDLWIWKLTPEMHESFASATELHVFHKNYEPRLRTYNIPLEK